MPNPPRRPVEIKAADEAHPVPSGGATAPALPAALAFLRGLDQSTALAPALAQAIEEASEAFVIEPEALALLPDARVLDVRRAALFAQAGTLIPGARWYNPVKIDSADAADLPHANIAGPLVVYCVHGHAVSRSAVLALRACGHDARFLRGGITTWIATGRPVVASRAA